jgi:hypothetical protein
VIVLFLINIFNLLRNTRVLLKIRFMAFCAYSPLRISVFFYCFVEEGGGTVSRPDVFIVTHISIDFFENTVF